MADEPVELTDAEIKALMLEIGIPAENATPELIAYYAGAFTEAQIAASELLYNTLVDQITGPVDAKALANARALADRNAATLAKGLVESELKFS
jgi:hypothetical protein